MTNTWVRAIPLLAGCWIGLMTGFTMGHPLLRSIDVLFPIMLFPQPFILSMMLFEIARISKYPFFLKMAVYLLGIFFLLTFFLKR